MKLLLCSVFPLILLFSVFSIASVFAESGQAVVYSSSGDGITVFYADAETGKLKEVQNIEEKGLMAITRDQRQMYAIGATRIFTYEIQANGHLKDLSSVDIEHGGVSYFDLDKSDRFLAASNYGKGTVTVWPIGDDGIAQGKPSAHLTLEQKSHSSVFVPNNDYLLVPATGPNKVFQLKFDVATGKLEPNDPPSASAPVGEGDAQQPRHLIFHPDGKTVYTTLERELPGVGVWKWDAKKGSLKVVQNIVTNPEGFEGVITTADLHLTPNAKFLYVSNRDITDRKAVEGASSIVGFKVDQESGRLEMIGDTPCEQVPRSFAIDRAGKFLYVAGQTAAKLGVYQIDQKTGALTRVQQLNTGPSPNWIECVTLK
tara:strand:- start:550 stop:1662 length:1113 start_codon:yes stop_codon:yes gene_type:complete